MPCICRCAFVEYGVQKQVEIDVTEAMILFFLKKICVSLARLVHFLFRLWKSDTEAHRRTAKIFRRKSEQLFI